MNQYEAVSGGHGVLPQCGKTSRSTKEHRKTKAIIMLRIAICDDVKAELQHIAALTGEYLADRGLSAEIREFSHPDSLLTSFKTDSFHIFQLDMVMPMVSGIELGQNIRRISTDAQIIYITTELGFALDADAVNPLHYLLKSVDKSKLFVALDLAAKKWILARKILLRSKRETVCVPFLQI